MFISVAGNVDVAKAKYVWENDRYRFHWNGFVFVLGIPSGVESVQVFAKWISNQGIETATSILKGNYFMVIMDKRSHTYYAFIDNSGGFEAFYSKDCISQSFLDIIKYGKMSRSQMSKEAIVEFIISGNVYMSKTLFPTIHKMDCNDILIIDRDGLKRLTKGLNIIDREKADFDFLEYFGQLVKSIQNNKISVDLSGGVDSRLLAVLLDHYGVEFETTISGVDGIDDVEIPKELSKVWDRPLYITYPCIDNLDEELDELFIVSDGLHDVLKQYRTVQHHKNRLQRHIDLALTGIAGEFLKDTMWVQDLPFYTSRRNRVDRFLRTRMHSIRCKDDYFTPEYQELNQQFFKRVMDELSTMELDINTRTYDLIYYNYKLKTVAAKFITSANQLLGCYAPFLELDLFNYGFHMKRRARFFNLFHRQMMTQLRPDVARIRTTEGGISASAEKLQMIKDVKKYMTNKVVRLTRKGLQKYLNRTYFTQTADHPDLYKKIRQMEITKRSIEQLKEEGILRSYLTLDSIHNNHLGSIITLGLLYRFLAQNDDHRDVQRTAATYR